MTGTKGAFKSAYKSAKAVWLRSAGKRSMDDRAIWAELGVPKNKVERAMYRGAKLTRQECSRLEKCFGCERGYLYGAMLRESQPDVWDFFTKTSDWDEEAELVDKLLIAMDECMDAPTLVATLNRLCILFGVLSITPEATPSTLAVLHKLSACHPSELTRLTKAINLLLPTPPE